MPSFTTGVSLGLSAVDIIRQFGAGNAPCLISLGGFKFSLNTLAFSEMTRTTEAAWAFVPRMGQLEAGQFTGPGSETLEIPGVLYPDRFGSALCLDQLRSMQANGLGWTLILGDGSVLGNWAILSIRETQSNFSALPAGNSLFSGVSNLAKLSGQPQARPLKIEFSILLKRAS